MTTIRPIEESDWPATWAILEPVFRAGDTYSFASDISEAEAFKVWVEVPAATFVVEDDSGHILGTYYIKANQPGQGAHVCNCGYVVGETSRGKGIASAMCEHSQQEAMRRGFRSMQYNLVVSTNTGAVRLWKKLGFEIVGALPEAFRHPTHGFVDAYVMYKKLET
ncbi:MAG: GNAT family N-acetyltransferase [Gammaproteobacteria bacterium]|nr:MAG: GNAT family N-acetyltransferase [Gammaproteobacteria bacterium]